MGRGGEPGEGKGPEGQTKAARAEPAQQEMRRHRSGSRGKNGGKAMPGQGYCSGVEGLGGWMEQGRVMVQRADTGSTGTIGTAADAQT